MSVVNLGDTPPSLKACHVFRLQDIMTAARDAVEAAESFSARLKDQNASIVALKARATSPPSRVDHRLSQLCF